MTRDTVLRGASTLDWFLDWFLDLSLDPRPSSLSSTCLSTLDSRPSTSQRTADTFP